MRPHPTTGVVPVGHLDGNVLAGPLSEIFRVDMTMATGECRHCRTVALLADAAVEIDDAGFIVRCSSCTHTLFTVVRSEARTWIDLQGLAALSLAHPAGS